MNVASFARRQHGAINAIGQSAEAIAGELKIDPAYVAAIDAAKLKRGDLGALLRLEAAAALLVEVAGKLVDGFEVVGPEAPAVDAEVARVPATAPAVEPSAQPVAADAQPAAAADEVKAKAKGKRGGNELASADAPAAQ